MKKLLPILSVLLFAASPIAAQINCTVVGRVVNRPQSSSMSLTRPYEDSRSNSRTIEIKDSTFSFTIQGTHPECYELVFADESNQGSWRPIKFCTTNGVVNMELYPQNDYAKNKVVGGVENKDLKQLNDYTEKLYDSLLTPLQAPLNKIKWEDQLTAEGKALFDSLKTDDAQLRNRLYDRRDKMEEQRTLYIAEVNAINRSLDSVVVVINRLRDEYEMAHLSIGSYSQIVDILSYFKSFAKRYQGQGSALDYIRNKYTLYAKTYPTHPYTKLCADMISSVAQVVVGGRYVDFTAPDLQGQMVKLSDQIAGKIALIDLWASWCGPCRAGSISFKPIYEQYKDRGFTIVGVAREKDNDKAMRRAIEKDGYEWLNLVELNDRAAIWRIYGIGNAAGGVYMVDRDGTILAVNPTAAEVLSILEAKAL